MKNWSIELLPIQYILVFILMLEIWNSGILPFNPDYGTNEQEDPEHAT